MGGICAPKSETIPTSTSVVSGTNLPEWVSKGGQEIWNQAQTIAQQPYQPYTGERVAPMGALQTQGIEAAGALPGIAAPYLSQAETMTQQGALPWDAAAAERYMNPYQATVMDDVTRRLTEQFATQGQGQAAKAVGAGAFGGARDRLEAVDLMGEQGRTLGGTLAQMGQTGYEGARAAFEADMRRQLAGGQQMGALGTTAADIGTRDVGTLMATGGMQQAQAQRELDVPYGEFVEQRDYPAEQLNWALGALRGVPYSTETTQTSAGTQVVPGTSALSQGAGVLGALGSWFG